MAEAAKKKTDKNSKDTPTKSKAILIRYRDRLTFLRQAKEYAEKDDVPRAVTFYMKYLDSLAIYYETTEKQLKPSLFDKQATGLAEILMVSQVYWDLAKAYDRNPKMHKESERCLEQFVKFSLGFKFQYINSEIIRKYLRKKMAYNQKSFQAAHDRINVNSKSCYVATFCFGEEHQVTNELRAFKKILLKKTWGMSFVNYYYRFSPPLVNFLENKQLIGPIFKIISRPLLKSFSFIIQKFIINE